jgi:serine/threonine protein kinase
VDSASGPHFQISPGEIIASRFKVRRILGYGAFGKVVECINLQDRSFKAVKIIRSEQRYIEEAKIEARILTRLKEADPSPSARFVHIVETFEFENTYCIVFERLGRSLYSLLRKNHYKGNAYSGLPINTIAGIARQVLETLQFFHKEVKLVHTDIKPENILLKKETLVFDAVSQVHVPETPDIKLIDFGGATFAEDDDHSRLISTRPYRAPEVVLELGWGAAADIWSVGCLLVELYTGQLLFPADNDIILLEMMNKVRGRMPRVLIRASPKRTDFYDERMRLRWPNPEKQAEVAAGQPYLEDLIPNCHRSLRNLVYELLEYDPYHRPTASAALTHSFFKEESQRHVRSKTSK